MIYRLTLSGGKMLVGNRIVKIMGVHVGTGDALGEEMLDLGLKAPMKQIPPRARFYFTEAGWKKFGEALIKVAKSKGYFPRVSRRKNPPRSAIVYRDAYQVAILPNKK